MALQQSFDWLCIQISEQLTVQLRKADDSCIRGPSAAFRKRAPFCGLQRKHHSSPYLKIRHFGGSTSKGNLRWAIKKSSKAFLTPGQCG